MAKVSKIKVATFSLQPLINLIFFSLGTVEGIKKFVETDGEYGKAAPDHDEL